MTNLNALPDDLPIPIDDGAAKHLVGLNLPSVSLRSTDGTMINPAFLSGLTVIYCYTRTGQPGVALPDNWDLIPGARGCTPQACSYRDHHAELKSMGVALFALSTQTHAYQKEMAERLHLTFPVLSDETLQFASALSLPTFECEGQTLMKRLTMICRDAKIIHVNYPVFPPDQDIVKVIEALKRLA